MRLVTAGTQREWVWLQPDTPAETEALHACAAQGEWTNGRGSEAIPRLRALSARLGYPVADPAGPARRHLVVVRRGENDLQARLAAIVRDGVTVVQDRRRAERRSSDQPTAPDRRRRERRQQPRESWDTQSVLVLSIESPP